MQIECRKEDSVFVIKPLQRTVDSSSASEFQQHLALAVQDGNDRIVLDTAPVSVIDRIRVGCHSFNPEVSWWRRRDCHCLHAGVG